MDNKLYDCAIIGGGLAGLTLSVQLADSGYSVVLFEQEKYPFHKVCGEYISMESFAFLERIGIPLSSMNLPMINEVKVSSPDGNSLTRKLSMGGFGISRYSLDSTLAALAVKKGVTLLEETKVQDASFSNNVFTIKANTQTYKAKTVFGTYGKKGTLDRVLNRKFRERKNYIGIKYHIKTDLAANRIELHNFKGGYCGISKVDGDKYCLCYLTDSQNLLDNDNSIKQMELKVLMKNPFLGRYFSEAEFLTKPVVISQISFHKKSAVENHILMLGDAAGSIAPLCGNGMSMAMNASYRAFILADRFLKGSITRDKLEKDYTQQWNTLFSARIKAGNYLQGLFGKEKMTNLAIGLLKHTPALTDSLINLTHGKRF